MNGLPWYKAYPRDFIEGTIGMPFELKGAYRLVLDLIYMQGGNLPDDPRYISGLLGCSIRRWNSMRLQLVEMGKLQVNGELLTNYRAVTEVETLAKLQRKQAENASGSRKNKDLQKPRPDHTEPDTEPEPDSKIPVLSEQSPTDEVRDAFDCWNNAAKAHGLSVAQKLSKKRRAAIGARLRECGGIEGWRAMLEKLAASPFLLGDNDRGWKADLDFVSTESKFTKLIEGGYDRGPGKANGAGGGRGAEPSRDEWDAAILGSVASELGHREGMAGTDAGPAGDAGNPAGAGTDSAERGRIAERPDVGVPTGEPGGLRGGDDQAAGLRDGVWAEGTGPKDDTGNLPGDVGRSAAGLAGNGNQPDDGGLQISVDAEASGHPAARPGGTGTAEHRPDNAENGPSENAGELSDMPPFLRRER